MAVETHWICDVCGKRIIRRDKVKDVNESLIQNWFCVRLHLNRFNSIKPEENISDYAYACSDECCKKVIDGFKKMISQIPKKQ